MAGSFSANARFLAYTGPVDGARLWIMVPAWAHRVTAPLIGSRGLDLFQRVILALSQAGVRQPDQVGARTGLQPRLCAYIIDQARAQGLLDKSGEPTPDGLRALRTGVVAEDTKWSVRYVFTDPVSGLLWPRAPERLEDAYVHKVSKALVSVHLGTAGKPDIPEALRLPVPDEEPRPPRPEHVIEAVHRDRQARESAQRRAMERRHNLGPTPENPADGYARAASAELLPELTRISFIAEPEPVEILAAIEAAPPDVPGMGWIAHDPFGIGVSGMLRDLVLTWAAGNPGLAERLEQMTGQREAEIAARHKKEQQRAAAQVEDILVRKYGPELRADRRVLDKLIDARLAHMEKLPGKATMATFGLFEELMARLCVAYPLSPEDKAYLQRTALAGPQGAGPGDAANGGTRNRQRAASRDIGEKILLAAQEIGAYPVPFTVRSAKAEHLAKIARESRPANHQFGTVVAACLLSAARRDDHPLRELMSGHPTALAEIDNLRDARNKQGHRLGAETVAEDLEWCLDLEQLVVPALLRVPAVP
jgi:hypothetical protein